MNKQKLGFTLIELLVVVAIIAVLASILFPVFARAKTAANATQSASNLRQIGLAWLLYGESHDDLCMPPRIPSVGTKFAYWWASVDGAGDQRPEEGLLYPYTHGAGIQADPLWPNRLRKATGFTGYGYNYRFLGTGNVGLGMIADPCQTVAFATSARISYTASRQLEGNTYLESPSQNYPTFHARANGRGVVGWTDGHASTSVPTLRKAPFAGFAPEPFAQNFLGELDRDGDVTTDELFDLAGD